MKVRPVGAEWRDRRTDGRTDMHDEAISRFSQLCERFYQRKCRPTLCRGILITMFTRCENSVEHGGQQFEQFQWFLGFRILLVVSCK
jgi:hypothetical protein